MLQQQVYILNTFLMIIDAVCVIASGYTAYFITRYRADYLWALEINVFVTLVLLVMFINNYAMGRFKLYSDRRTTFLNLFCTIFEIVCIEFGILAAIAFAVNPGYDLREFFIFFAICCLVSIIIGRLLFRLYIYKMHGNKINLHKILIVADSENGKFISDLLNSQLSLGHEIIGRLSIQQEEDSNVMGTIENLSEVLRNKTVDDVVFALSSNKAVDLSRYLQVCKKIGVTARILPALWNIEKGALTVEKCQNVPLLVINSVNFNATGLLYKRLLDLVGGLVGTLLFLLLYPFVGLAIKLDSKGPVIFKQQRKGQHGRVFNLYKFRTMFADAEQRKKDLLAQNQMKGAMFKLQNDPRITKIGRWLRKTSIDEFPQFINVLKGEMSLVGTRPPTLDEVKNYEEWHLKRIAAKPGLTGLWQVSGRNKISDFNEIVKLDCRYLDNWRFSDDIKILFKTVWVVLKRKGAI